MFPLKLRGFPSKEVNLYFYKNMMTDFLARTNDLHSQNGGHYLKHAVSNNDFRKQTMDKFGKKSHMWFSQKTLHYTLKTSLLAKIKKQVQPIWDQILFEQQTLLERIWNSTTFLEQVTEVAGTKQSTKE